MTYRKKLIEVALPLDAINEASAKEKSIRHGHPSTLHLWWARRPLAACRAVIFASLVDDPSSHPNRFPTEELQTMERERLFNIVRQFVRWENINNQSSLDTARAEIMRSTDNNPPPLLDPFSGGGSIPLEGQRLGLEVYASDLNPVAVLIDKALVEIPPKFAKHPPVNPDMRARALGGEGWIGVHGLAEDIRYYGKWMRDEAQERIGYLYPNVALSKEHGGRMASVIAWLWARTVRCPNPACHAQMPLVRSFWLSTKPGDKVWVEPLVDRVAKTVQFKVRWGQGSPPEGTKQRGQSQCIVCQTNLTDAMLRDQARTHGIGFQQMAIVADSDQKRVYLDPLPTQETSAVNLDTTWLEQPLSGNARWFSPPGYGLSTFRDLFTPRQLLTLTTFSDLVSEAREQVRLDAVVAGLTSHDGSLGEPSGNAEAYADAVATYLGLGVSRLTDICNALVKWGSAKTQVQHLFGRQAVPMTWDFAEPNVFAGAAGDLAVSLGNLIKALEGTPSIGDGHVYQADATKPITRTTPLLISTDPPYYDNIGYADLSDFFYIWLRRSLSKVYPDLFSTVLTPKIQELIATPQRFDGSKERAQHFFEEGLGSAFLRMKEAAHPDYPLTVYYAFKQAEVDGDDGENIGSELISASTGWETMLEGLLKAGFAITGTWPIRTERSARSVGIGTNALASSIVLVCRPRPTDALVTTRREFLNALKRELPVALRRLQHGNIAPVDLAQATLGPGMAVFSRYGKVMEADGSAMRVRTALQLINQALDAVLTEQEGEFDTDTRWAIAWFEQFGTGEGQYGDAETLSKAKGLSRNNVSTFRACSRVNRAQA